MTFDLFGEEIIDGHTVSSEPIGFLKGKIGNKLNDFGSISQKIVDREGILSDFMPPNASKAVNSSIRSNAWTPFADVIETITEDNESEETDITNSKDSTDANPSILKASVGILNEDRYKSEKVWRKAMVPHILNNTMITSSGLLNPGRKNRIAKQVIAKKKEEEAMRKLN